MYIDDQDETYLPENHILFNHIHRELVTCKVNVVKYLIIYFN